MMKLRNKKTGEIVDLSEGFIKDAYNGESIIIKSVAISYEEGYLYDSLAELNEEWEDYTSSEPLIKDEKIRKAIRAWAEAIGATRNIVFNGSWKICSFFYENNKGGFEKLLIYGDNDLEELKRYTITELCGEEKE